jgi:hypothetical protein
MFDGYECYIYAKVPKPSAESIYGKQVEWVRKDGYLPVKTVYYDKNGKKLKVLEYTDLRKTPPDGIHYSWRIVMTNLQDGHRTEITRLWVFLDTGLDQRYVTTRHLRKPVKFYSHPKGMWNVWDEARKQLAKRKRTPEMSAR